MGANSGPARCLVAEVRKGHAATIDRLQQALKRCDVPVSSQKFVMTTMELSARPVHSAAAVFLFSRESLIPLMFRSILHRLGENASLFARYLDVHIEIDEEEHGPMAMRIVKKLCGEDLTKWQDARDDSVRAIRARDELWDAIYESFEIKPLENAYPANTNVTVVECDAANKN